MNYIDEIALDIYERTEGPGKPDAEEMVLYRMYALLSLAKGTETTTKDVHDAWAAWCAKDRPNHPSLIPFEELSGDVQELDIPYLIAIQDSSHAAMKGARR